MIGYGVSFFILKRDIEKNAIVANVWRYLHDSEVNGSRTNFLQVLFVSIPWVLINEGLSRNILANRMPKGRRHERKVCMAREEKRGEKISTLLAPAPAQSLAQLYQKGAQRAEDQSLNRRSTSLLQDRRRSTATNGTRTQLAQ